MKVKLKSGDTKLKISFQGNPNGWDKMIESMFSRFDAGKISKAYAKIPAEIMNFYDEMGKAFVNQSINNENTLDVIIALNEFAVKSLEQLIKANKKKEESFNDTDDGLDVFPSNGHDIYNYFARFGIANFQIQAIMELEGKIDFEELKKAVRLSVDAEPVFGCRLVEKDPPYWKRLPNLDEVEFCSMEETDNIEEAVEAFLESPLDMDTDPMVKIRLIRCGDYDTLCLKINHSCCDGTGTKEYLKLLSDIYTCIDNDGVFEYKSGDRGRNDQDRLFDALGIQDPETAWDPMLEVPKTMWKFPWKHGSPENIRVVMHELPAELWAGITAYSKARGATINDMLLTALYRTMFEISQPVYDIPMDISITVDLRRYLPDQKTSAIRNFSGGCDTKLSRIANETFEGTLSRVTAMMNNIKSGRPGLQSAIGLERIEKMSLGDIRAYFQAAASCPDIAMQNHVFCSDLGSPVLSNLGFISKDLLYFGKQAVTNAFIVPPVVCAPGFLLVAGTYNGIIILTASYYEELLGKEDAEGFLARLGEELVEGCKVQ